MLVAASIIAFNVVTAVSLVLQLRSLVKELLNFLQMLNKPWILDFMKFFMHSG